MEEQWLPVTIKPFTHYHVSNLGRIRGPLAIRKTRTNKFGYLSLHLSNGPANMTALVHILVARAFLGEPPPGHRVNHKNGIKADCYLDNLEYVTAQENSTHASKMFLLAFGERNRKAKLNEQQISEIRSSKVSAPKLARAMGVSKSQIYRIKWDLAWRHLKHPSSSDVLSVP